MFSTFLAVIIVEKNEEWGVLLPCGMIFSSIICNNCVYNDYFIIKNKIHVEKSRNFWEISLTALE